MARGHIRLTLIHHRHFHQAVGHSVGSTGTGLLSLLRDNPHRLYPLTVDRRLTLEHPEQPLQSVHVCHDLRYVVFPAHYRSLLPPPKATRGTDICTYLWTYCVRPLSTSHLTGPTGAVVLANI